MVKAMGAFFARYTLNALTARLDGAPSDFQLERIGIQIRRKTLTVGGQFTGVQADLEHAIRLTCAEQ